MEHRKRNQRQSDQHQIHQNIHTKIKQINEQNNSSLIECKWLVARNKMKYNTLK